MGYTTEFDGILEFTVPYTPAYQVKLETILGEDVRDHPEWNDKVVISYIDLEVCGAHSGLQWSGAEKTYHMKEAVELVIRLMREEFPDFGLRGQFLASGEEAFDNWYLISDDEGVRIKEIPKTDDLVTCPHCDEEFSLKDAK